jgi:hypothetical protein
MFDQPTAGTILSMSFMQFFGCIIGWHQPLRRDVLWDGRSYIGQCSQCGAPLRRHGRRNWRKRKD